MISSLLNKLMIYTVNLWSLQELDESLVVKVIENNKLRSFAGTHFITTPTEKLFNEHCSMLIAVKQCPASVWMVVAPD